MRRIRRRRGLAVPAERIGGEPVLLGEVDPEAVAAWRMVSACGRIRSEELARLMGVEPDSCDTLLCELLRRRLVRRCGDSFESLSFSASAAREVSARESRVEEPGAGSDPGRSRHPGE